MRDILIRNTVAGVRLSPQLIDSLTSLPLEDAMSAFSFEDLFLSMRRYFCGSLLWVSFDMQYLYVERENKFESSYVSCDTDVPAT